MTEITSTATNPTGAAGVAQQAQTTSAESELSDFDTYLTLLTAQLRYQDPLDPSDPTEFVAQLASFAAVEQQVSTNDKLDRLVESLTAEDLTKAASLIGLEAEIVGGAAQFDGAPVSFRSNGNPQADGAVISISNDQDEVVASFAIDAAARTTVWDGSTTSGAVAPAGTYSASISYFNDGDSIAEESAHAFVRITEVRPTNGGSSVVFADGSVRDSAELTALREGGSA